MMNWWLMLSYMTNMGVWIALTIAERQALGGDKQWIMSQWLNWPSPKAY